LSFRLQGKETIMSSSTLSNQVIIREGEAVRLLPNHGGASSAGASLSLCFQLIRHALCHWNPWQVVFTLPLA
jgi:hypothetical protein